MPEHSIPDTVIDIARPLIRRATHDGHREGVIDGKLEFLEKLEPVLDRAESLDDVRRWMLANRMLLTEFRA